MRIKQNAADFEIVSNDKIPSFENAWSDLGPRSGWFAGVASMACLAYGLYAYCGWGSGAKFVRGRYALGISEIRIRLPARRSKVPTL
jgi:hypothetical protein